MARLLISSLGVVYLKIDLPEKTTILRGPVCQQGTKTRRGCFPLHTQPGRWSGEINALMLWDLIPEILWVILKLYSEQSTYTDSWKTVTSRQNTEILIYFHYSETCTSNSEKCTSIQNNALLSGWSTHFEVEYDWIELTQQLIKSVQHSE